MVEGKNEKINKEGLEDRIKLVCKLSHRVNVMLNNVITNMNFDTIATHYLFNDKLYFQSLKRVVCTRNYEMWNLKFGPNDE